MRKLRSWKAVLLLCVVCALAANSSLAQSFTTLASFNGADGEEPGTPLVQGLDANFYGTTFYGGTNNNPVCGSIGCGTVFKVTPSGLLKTVYSFCAQPNCTDGANPGAGLMLGTNGDFYGTTLGGGANGQGTIFEITPQGTLTTLYSFCSQPDCTDGAEPLGELVQATDRSFYGTTFAGAANTFGTVFKITPEGRLNTLHTFDSTHGSGPSGALVQAADGNLYGTTQFGGASNNCNRGCGTVFKITPEGTLSTLYSFDGTDGYQPYAGLAQASNGNFYGTTVYGGAYGDGTLFEVTPTGKLSSISFDGTDGSNPYALPVQATDGNVYGATAAGGSNGDGTIFKITPAGTLTTLQSLDGANGVEPLGGLLQSTNGNLYGTTSGGGASNDGTVFGLALGLPPFIETVPTSGKVGTPVKIFGNNLTGATSVTFDGTPLVAFMLVSSTEITTTVPSSATTGYWTVTTPSGMLRTNVKFQVRP